MSDQEHELHLTRRTFLQAAGLAGTGAVIAGSGLYDTEISQARDTSGPKPLPGSYTDAVVPTLCEMCVWRCGVHAKVVNGVIEKLDGNPDHPHSEGYLCARGQSGLMMTYDGDRVLDPLMRVGDRGSGRFRIVSWDEALDYVAGKMQQIKDTFGPEAMIFSSTHNISQPLFENLLYGYGSPNYGTQRSLCFNAMVTAHLMTYGIEEPARRYDNVNYIILAGRNMFGGISTSETRALMNRIAAGAHVVSLDPRFTETAAKSADWLPIKPGTDSAFFLALINIIISEQLYDEWFVSNYTIGFDELAEGVQDYTPEWAAAITQIPADTISRIAHELASNRPHAFVHPGWRTSNFVNSFHTERAIAALNALLGLVTEDGQSMFASEASVALGAPPQPAYPLIRAARLDGAGSSRYPVVPLKLGIFQELRDAILTGEPYQAHGWFIARQNPILSLPERRKTKAAFEKLGLIVVMDIIMNDSAWYADVVLPEATYLERYDPLMPVGKRVFLRQPVIEPRGNAKSALWIYKQLGERLGLGDYFQYEDEEDYLRQQLQPWTDELGITLEQLQQTGYFEVQTEEEAPELRWNTPSGKVELASETLRNAGFAPIPTWEQPLEPAESEFYLLTGKVGQHTQFATQNNAYLHEVAPRNRLWMNPTSAAARGIKTGDTVRVTSPAGEVTIEVWLTEGIRPDCVYMTPGFGHESRGLRKAYGQGASDSELHVTYTDPISGGQALTQTFVTVEKV
jgi:thiosulfate reductase/polysulfide reductase chain A